MGSAVPTGYVAINKKLKIKPEEGEMIRFMFESYLKHKSITAVCKLVKDNYGIEYRREMIKHLLKNLVYLGKVKHKKEVIKGGFIKFYRDFQDWHWYSDANVLQLYLHLMLTANFKDKPFKDIIVHRGEVVISHMRLAETLDKSKDQIRRLLNKLKRTNDITTTRIGCATLVRLINYNKYQGFEDTTPAPTALVRRMKAV